jgi:proton glutamate symport protein
VAILIGIGVASTLRPGALVSPEQRARLQAAVPEVTCRTAKTCEQLQHRSPLQSLVELVPENLLQAAQDNRECYR